MIIDPENDILIVVDVQNDFCPKREGEPYSALPVNGGNEIVAPINALMERFEHIVFTQDWHPKGHSSFASSHKGNVIFDLIKMPYGEQTLWPDHCVQGSWGAKFHPVLNQNRAKIIQRKGMNPLIDSYSAFYENDKQTPTGLIGTLQKIIRLKPNPRLIFVGLAFDFCVYYSAMDAVSAGFSVTVIENLTAAIDLDGSKNRAKLAMEKAGVALY